VTANASGVLGERNAILVLQDVIQVLDSGGDSAALDGLTDLTAVLVMHANVLGTGLGDFIGRKNDEGDQMTESGNNGGVKDAPSDG
jgi:hypothetical protein